MLHSILKKIYHTFVPVRVPIEIGQQYRTVKCVEWVKEAPAEDTVVEVENISTDGKTIRYFYVIADGKPASWRFKKSRFKKTLYKCDVHYIRELCVLLSDDEKVDTTTLFHR